MDRTMAIPGKRAREDPTLQSLLSEEELQECERYTIWYAGTGKRAAPASPSADDDFYHADEGDQVAYRFEVGSLIGKGAFAKAFKCHDHKHGRDVALKITRRGARYTRAAMNELELLLQTRDAPNVVTMYKGFAFRDHRVISMELMHQSVYDALRNRDYQPFSWPEVRRVCVDVGAGLRQLHEQDIVHLDVKPENLLLTAPLEAPGCRVKLCDLGSAVKLTSFTLPHHYVASRYYRPPEVYLQLGYTVTADVWAFACIISEICTGYPLFAPRNEHDLLPMHTGLLGHCPADILEASPRVGSVFHLGEDGTVQLRLRSSGRRVDFTPRDFSKALGAHAPELTSVMEHCLRWRQDERPSKLDLVSLLEEL